MNQVLLFLLGGVVGLEVVLQGDELPAAGAEGVDCREILGVVFFIEAGRYFSHLLLAVVVVGVGVGAEEAVGPILADEVPVADHIKFHLFIFINN